MIFKIRTSKKTMDIFSQVGNSENLQPFALSKISIALSLHSKDKLSESDFHTDNNGLELNRQTITGDYDKLFKCLIEQYEGKALSDDEYLQKYMKAHLDRGAKYLLNEFRYGGDFLCNLINLENSL